MLGRLRFILLSVFGAVACAAVGALVLHLAMHAWQTGEFHARGGVLMTPATHPIGFAFAMTLGMLVGGCMVLGSPLVLAKILSSKAEQEKFAANMPYLFGKTRPSIFYAFVAIVLLVAWALLRR